MLCRWVRDRIVEVNDFNALDNRLGEFVLERRVENEMGNTSHSRNLGSSCTERELTKLQSGLGLSRSKNVCLSDLNSSSSGSETPPKQTYKMCKYIDFVVKMCSITFRTMKIDMFKAVEFIFGRNVR